MYSKSRKGFWKALQQILYTYILFISLRSEAYICTIKACCVHANIRQVVKSVHCVHKQAMSVQLYTFDPNSESDVIKVKQLFACV